MTVIDFNIILDGNEGPYTPGQSITGKVGLVLNSPRSISKIQIKFKGEANVAWSKKKGHGKSRKKVWYRSHERYFKTKFILYESQGDSNLPPGDHVYPFSFFLPNNIPSSFTGLHGKVKYFAIAQLQIFKQLISKRKKEVFIVKNFLDLNCFPILKTPSETIKSKTFNMIRCLPGGEVTTSLSIPRSGFVSNETIPLLLEINNEDFISFEKITAYIIQKIEWRARKKRKHSRKILKSFTLRSTKSNMSEMILDNVPVPDRDCPYLENCHIIMIKHELWIEIDRGAGRRNLNLFLPITIGDIAFTQDEPNPRHDHFMLTLDKSNAQISDLEYDENTK